MLMAQFEKISRSAQVFVYAMRHDADAFLAESGVHVLYAGGETRRDLAGGSVKVERTLLADPQASKGGRKTCGEVVFAGWACRVMSVIGALR
jgi:hypothetical protein